MEFIGQSLVHAGQQTALVVFAKHLLPTRYCDCGGLVN